MTYLHLFKWAIPAIFVGAAAVVHLRGKQRFAFVRQVFNHSTLLAPYNALVYLFSAVPGRALLPLNDFPQLRLLRDNGQLIRDEALALNDEGHIRAALDNDDVGFNSLFKTGWALRAVVSRSDTRGCVGRTVLARGVADVSGRVTLRRRCRSDR